MNEPGPSLIPPAAPPAHLVIVSANRPGAEAGALEAAQDRGADVDGCACTGGGHPRGPVASASPGEALRRNVRDSDATIVAVFGDRDAGDRFLATRIAKKMGRPCVTVALPTRMSRMSADAVRALLEWAHRNGATRIHVTGPSEAKAPGIEAATAAVVGALLDAAEARS